MNTSSPLAPSEGVAMPDVRPGDQGNLAGPPAQPPGVGSWGVQITLLQPGSVVRPRISVIIPAFRRPGPLRELLGSLAVQRLPAGDIEVVVSDDGSGPEVAALLTQIAPSFPHRLVLVAGENAGPGIARNRGVQASSAPCLAFIDSDCLASADWLCLIDAALEAGATLVHGPVTSSLPAIEPFVHSFQVWDSPICGANFAMPRVVYDALGGFRAEVSRVAEDHDLFDRARAAGIAPLFVRKALVAHPPRLKRMTSPWRLPPASAAALRDLASFYRLSPGRRPDAWRHNRHLALRFTTKQALLWGPWALPGIGALAGLTLFLVWASAKWAMTNRRLGAAGETWRVPVGECMKYALVIPFAEGFELLHRWRFGLLQRGR